MILGDDLVVLCRKQIIKTSKITVGRDLEIEVVTANYIMCMVTKSTS